MESILDKIDDNAQHGSDEVIEEGTITEVTLGQAKQGSASQTGALSLAGHEDSKLDYVIEQNEKPAVIEETTAASGTLDESNIPVSIHRITHTLLSLR